MNKLSSFIWVCVLLLTVSAVNAQGQALRFFSVNQINEYLSDGEHTEMSIKYMQGESKPQYLIMSTKSVRKEIDHISSRFLVRVQEGETSRLAFVNGSLYEDNSLVLQDAGLTLESALFSFRLVNKDDVEGDFLIEAWSNNEGEGEWIKIDKGTPVLIKTLADQALKSEADIFNIENSFPENMDDVLMAANLFDVTADYGRIIIKGANGKKAVVTDVYGQTITKQIVSSNEVSLSVPSGIAFVAIDNQPAVKVWVK
ncbi:hypothetical protein M2459_003591 [Parabacteroides sp. PF5-5]|uniref:DUF6383 domain-containing protein n=1 Tax=unclassified Parabacteroides TaxID=2649774 RepID=UPI00247583DB|nr:MULTISPECIES: DUF6383 domain-containing protein [unclassified Parabacteroides]MDH6306976.1 hypothetical protein [Parabacteroides sp. PH5-39]MDH6317850.1 hypothetical protein [Parabacteroides sp. PF5-13]MDH6321581.1 hypothetical protein [Parabacteroides sp. PH5-13]MDH6325343.1 hypothetical protein [Parabacteroides sp. PH5-8]MDH6329014.1 hypothetical protein [Parabacteroides sp. PH5-41]